MDFSFCIAKELPDGGAAWEELGLHTNHWWSYVHMELQTDLWVGQVLKLL